MKLEYFRGHARATWIRMALAYTNVEYEDYLMDFKEFGMKKAGGAYTYG